MRVFALVSARLGLCLVLVVACAAPLGAPKSDRAGLSWPWRTAKLPDPGVDLRAAAGGILSEAIRFDTTNPPGAERPLAEFLVAVATRLGLESRVVATPPGASGAERAAAWALRRGQGSKRPVVLLSHLDVVPAEPAEWTVDPFEGVVGGGFVVGRGALDAKGIAIVHLLTLAELERRDIRLSRDVILLAVPDEEAGGRHGSGAIVRDRPELLRGAEFLLTEGGGIVAGTTETPELWGVTVTEKSPCWLELRARGLAGHGASAAGRGAVPRLVRALDRIRRLEAEVRVIPEVERMFQELASLAPTADRAGYASLARTLATDPDFRERFLAEPGRASLVRDTVAITVLEGSPSVNIAPAMARARLDARLLPGRGCPDFVVELHDAVDDPEIEIEILLAFEAGASSIDSELFAAIRRSAARRSEGARVIPRVISGFTDAHYFRELGITSYGFVPRRLRPIETRGIHGVNERISLDNLVYGVETLIEILIELAGRNG